MRAPPSTASTCSSSPRIASRRSIRRPDACSPRFRRPAAAATPGWRGPKARSGSGSIATGRFIRSIPRPARSCARSSPTASSPASRGSTASSGTAPGKASESELRRVDPRTGEVLERLEMPRGRRRLGPRVRWRRPVLLRRRQERQGQGRAPAAAGGYLMKFASGHADSEREAVIMPPLKSWLPASAGRLWLARDRAPP